MNCMHNTKKVAKWEIKRNLKNKSFIIGMFLTPIIFLAFFLLPDLFRSDDKAATTTVYVNDQLGVYDQLEAVASKTEWRMEPTDITEQEAAEALEGEDDAAYVFIDERLSKPASPCVHKQKN